MESKEVQDIRKKMKEFADSNRASHSKSYLKSDYSFYGLTVPQERAIAKQYKHLSIYDAYNLFDELWNSGNHEEMSLALYLLGNYKKKFSIETWNFLFNGDRPRIEKAKSWDHIDELSSHITGEIFLTNPNLQSEIKRLSESRNPWMRRLSIVSQYPLIKKGKIQLTLLLAEKLVYDNDIYVQKGAGWMLRECGKKNPASVEQFIKMHKDMKAAAFSYSTEKMLFLRKKLKEEIKNEKINGKQKMFDSEEEPIKEENKINLSPELEKIKHFRN